MPPIPSDPLDWRPQRAAPGRPRHPIVNAILEPLWEGDHVLAHATRQGVVHIVSDDGDDLDALDPALTAAVAAAVDAADAVVDGYLTTQATRPGNTVSLATAVRTHPLGLITGNAVEMEVAPLDEGEEGAVAFVAVDLLRADGENLFDVPLLERKRILESVILPGDRVRVSPCTRPPVQPWLRSWEAAGFRGLVMKAANSRYIPGAETDEWTTTLARPR